MPPESSEIFAPGLLEGQVAIVTGGGTGIGRATAAEFVRCGASVVIAGRRGEVLEEAASGLGASCAWVSADVRSGEECARVVEFALERFGRADVLVNNAGGQYFVPAESIVLKGFQAVTRLNVGGTLGMSYAAYERAFRVAGRGTIVNVTLTPHHGLAGMTHSSAARAAVEGATRELAAAWRDDGVTVCAVALGHFLTDALAKYPESVRAGFGNVVPLGRLGRVEEAAWLMALLASPVGRRFSGSVVSIDGARDNWVGPWPPEAITVGEGVVPTEERRRPLPADPAPPSG